MNDENNPSFTTENQFYVPSSAPPPAEKTFDPGPQREVVRSVLAVILIVCVSVEIACMLVAFSLGRPDVGAIKEFSSVVFTPTLILVGAVTGFYFASNR